MSYESRGETQETEDTPGEIIRESQGRGGDTGYCERGGESLKVGLGTFRGQFHSLGCRSNRGLTLR